MPRAPRMVLALLVLLVSVAPAATAQVTMRNMQLLSHFNDYPGPPNADNYSACWGYVALDGREYAILGANPGTAIYNVTDPANAYQVGFIPGPPCIWREMKSYRSWIYVSTECWQGLPSDGMQIIRMTDPEHPVLAGTYAAGFLTAHTVSVDTTRGILIFNGTRDASHLQSGMRILSLADPEHPTELTWWPGGSIPMNTLYYAHDSLPIGNRLYSSSIYYGYERIFDFTNPAAPNLIASWTYPGAFTHNSWPDPTGNVLYVTDETQGEPLKIFDISNPSAPLLANGITSNPQAIVHNAHVKGSELYLANYTEGFRVLDDADPVHPAEFAWADSWPGASGGFYGVWEAYPYFPSGTVITSDLQTGLYVYRPVRNYGVVRVLVEDASTHAPLPGVMVHDLPLGDSLATTADGIVQFAPDPGPATVSARRLGYDDGQVSLNVVNGERDSVVISLAPKATTAWSGTLKDRLTGLPLSDGEVDLVYTPLKATSAADGSWSFGSLPVDEYAVYAGRPGYVPVRFTRQIDADAAPQDFSLGPAATYDNLETPTPWIVGASGDDATTGIWTRVTPLGTGAPQEIAVRTASASPRAQSDPPRTCSCGLGSCAMGSPCGCGCASPTNGHEMTALVPGDVAPGADRTPGSGTTCYVTGQGTDPNSPSENDVDGGRTSLTSPRLDLTGMSDPTIGFWRWLYVTQADPNDWLAVLLSNDDGATWVAVDTLREKRNLWEEVALHVSRYLPATSLMRVRFVAADLGPGTIVEAAVDDITTYDAALGAVDAPPSLPARFALRAAGSNPARGAVSFFVDLPRAADVDVVVVDARGTLVRHIGPGRADAGVRMLVWDGRDESGRDAPAGIYFARAQNKDAEPSVLRFVRLR